MVLVDDGNNKVDLDRQNGYFETVSNLLSTTMWSILMKKIAFALAVCSLIQGCAMAPLSNSTTARTNGSGKWSTNVGAGGRGEPAYYYLRQTYGVTDNFDAGVIAEAGINNIIGLTAQYAFLNQPAGWSTGVLGGVGVGQLKGRGTVDGQTVENDTTNAYHIYAGPIVSYKYQSLEPYLAARLNYVNTSTTVRAGSSDNGGLNIKTNTAYATFTAGTNYWFTPNLGVTANVNCLTSSDEACSAYANLGVNIRY